MKNIVWDKSTKKTVRLFSKEVRQELGSLLLSLQRGNILGMPQSRPLRTVGNSAFEIRIKDPSGVYRIVYVLYDGKNILIPHAFTKKTQKTPKKEIDTAIKRLRRLINETF